MPPPNRTMSTLEWGLLVLLSVVWGGSFFFNRVALDALPPLTLVLLRVGLAAPVLILAQRAMGRRMPRAPRIWAAFFVMGLLNNALPFALIVWGQMQIASGLASILNATTPLAGVIVAHIFTADEKMTANRLLGVLAGIAGVAVLIGPQALQGFGSHLVRELACLAAAVSYAVAGVYGRRFRRLGIAPMTTAAGQVTASAMLLLPLALIVDKPWLVPVPPLTVFCAVTGLVLLSTALAYTVYFRLLATVWATNLLLVTFLIPVSAILLGTLVLGERLSVDHFAGLMLIGAGLAAIDGRLLPKRTRRDPEIEIGRDN